MILHVSRKAKTDENENNMPLLWTDSLYLYDGSYQERLVCRQSTHISRNIEMINATLVFACM